MSVVRLIDCDQTNTEDADWLQVSRRRESFRRSSAEARATASGRRPQMAATGHTMTSCSPRTITQKRSCRTTVRRQPAAAGAA
jgi:hypothetical protein